MANTRIPKTPPPAVAPPTPVPAGPVPAAQTVVVRVATVVAHEGNYRGRQEDVVLTPRVEALIEGGVLELLGTVNLDRPRIITVHTPR